jgi:hypothetical protein
VTGHVIAYPEPGPHNCSPGVTIKPATDPTLLEAGITTYTAIPSQYTHPAGTVWECECGKTWVSKPPRWDNAPGDVSWRRERSWERRRRLRKEAR